MDRLTTSLPILIVGAGPTGMTAAVELARFGFPVRIIDKEEAPATSSRAIGVQARTLELMEMRGLVDQFVRLGNYGQGGSIYGGGKRILRLDFSRLDTRYNYILFISQVETERILRERLEHDGVRIERGVELIAFSQDDSSVTAVLRRKNGATEEYKSAYLIDAEGAHSNVRTSLGLKFEGKTFDQGYVLGDLHVDSELSDSDFHIFSSEHGFMALFPLGNKHFRLIADHPLRDAHKGSPPLDECQSIYDQRSHIPAYFRDMSWSSYFYINSRMISRLRFGRVFLGGDSAHIHSPAGAQGMNTGIQDMINLAWKLACSASGYGAAELLDTYQADRIPVMRTVLQKTEGLTGVIASESKVFRALFNHLAPFIAGADFVQQIGTERMSQLAVNYRESPLSEDHGSHHGIHAGDRVPDVSVQLISSSRAEHDRQLGQSLRMFELLDPSRFTLLTVADRSQGSSVEKIEQAVHEWARPGWHSYSQFLHVANTEEDRGNGFARIFVETSGSEEIFLYFIRPDGYVGFRGQARDMDSFKAYVKRWLSKGLALAASVSR
jgi:2-polyprenyl-6-methoxyphenol hydroxylase-like FAD-dependent oxidoreductase